jgi:hypothetical protein
MSKGFFLKRHLPEAFWEHHRAARREHLLAYRSLFDAAIERLERKPPPVEAERPKRRLRDLLPEEFRDHLRAAGREQLLAYRSLLDALIERQEKKPVKARRIEVE